MWNSVHISGLQWKNSINLKPYTSTDKICFSKWSVTLPQPYVMARRQANGFICEFLRYFKCLCVVHECVYAFIHQWIGNFTYKNTKICMQNSIWWFSVHHIRNVAHFISFLATWGIPWNRFLAIEFFQNSRWSVKFGKLPNLPNISANHSQT